MTHPETTLALTSALVSTYAAHNALPADAKHKIEAWRRDYNESRPHMALDAATPLEFARKAGLCDERTKQMAVEN